MTIKDMFFMVITCVCTGVNFIKKNINYLLYVVRVNTSLSLQPPPKHCEWGGGQGAQ